MAEPDTPIAPDYPYAAEFARLRTLRDAAYADDHSLDAALDTVAEIGATILEVPCLAIVLEHADHTIDRVATWGVSVQQIIGSPLLDDALRRRVTVDGAILSGASADILGVEPVVNGYAVRSVLAVPVRVEGHPSGLVAAGRVDATPFGARDEHAAAVIAATAGYLDERMRAAVRFERQQRWLIESTELTREIVAGLHERPLAELVERVLAVADADLVTVNRLSSDGEEVVVTAAAGPGAGELTGRRFVRAQTLFNSVIERADAQRVDMRERGPATQRFAREFGIGPALLVPFVSHNGVLAVMRSPERPPFSTVEAAMAATFAAQMSLALELAEARVLRERRALLAERDRIARDLHDHVIQRLFAVGLTMQGLVAEVQGEASGQLAAGIDELDHTILQIRAAIYRLAGPVLADAEALRRRIDELIVDLTRVVGFPIDLRVEGPVDFAVDAEVGDDVIAVLRETLTNVAKHSGADSVTVRVAVADDRLVLTVTDNGHGIGATERRSGLANLRARAEAHHGSMEVESGSGGTTIRWRVPTGD